MGTCHITAVVLDGQYKVAQYGQWDGYPSGQGYVALEFLRNKMDRPLFESKVRALHFNTKEQDRAEWLQSGADPDSDWVTMDEAETHRRLYPHNSRDTGAAVLELIQTNPAGLGIQDELEFAADSLMCEWVYVIDLDRNTFEAFKGFNKSPLGNGERFYFLQKPDEEYYPVKLVASWSLDRLPTDFAFAAKFNGELEDLTGMEPMLGTPVTKEDNPEETEEN